MDDLGTVNDKVKKLKEVERVRAWQLKNHEKVKKYRTKWNIEKRNEYQRAYRAKRK